MANKKYVYIQLYPKDLLADEKLAKCDKACAWGAYLALLNIMAMEPVRGCLRLRDWDTHPNNERKSLVANFRNANSLITKSAAFARIVSKRTPLKVKEAAEGIEQLVIFGVVVMHDDALIQPRMFREGKGHIEGYNPAPEAEEAVALKITGRGDRPTHKKEKNKRSLTPAPALRTNTRDSNESEHEYEYINNNGYSMGNKGGAGGSRSLPKSETTVRGKTQQPPAARPASGRTPVADNPPTLEEVQAYFYERAAQGKPLEYISAEEFYVSCETDGWTHGKDRKPIANWKSFALGCETYRRNHGDPSVAERQAEAEKQKQEKRARQQGRGQPRGGAPGSQPTAGQSPRQGGRPQARPIVKSRTASAPLVTERSDDKYDEDI